MALLAAMARAFSPATSPAATPVPLRAICASLVRPASFAARGLVRP